MRSLFYLGTALIISQLLVAQTLNDVIYLTQSGLNGSARYTSMAGAFGALGGDLTAISDNPASSSVFLNTEIGGSLNFQSRENKGMFFGETKSNSEENFYFDQFGAVFIFNNTNQESSWTRISAAINVNRINNYDQKASISGINKTGVSEYFLHFANGIAFEEIQLYDDESISDIYRYLGDEIGFGAQQAFLGYQSYIIDPLSLNNQEKSYLSNVSSGKYRQNLDILNNGLHRKISFNFSTLYKNTLHLGANINRHKIEFRNEQKFFEGDQGLDSFIYDINFNNDLISYGDGFSIQFGGILKFNNLRLGISYDSPQWIDIQDETQQKISAYRFEESLEIQEIINPDITNFYLPYRLKIPSKTSLSLAYVFNQIGLISLEYSNQNLSNSMLSQESVSEFLNNVNNEVNNSLNALNTIKIGSEYRLRNISFRAGYLYQTKNQDFIMNDNQAITFGIGFDFGASNINLSFVNFQQNQGLKLFSNGLTTPYEISKNLTQLTLSYNFKL